MLIQALLESKQQDNIEVINKYLNGKVLYPYTPLSLVPKMDSSNYDANGGTPLFDETAKLLATVIAKSQDFKNNGIQVRTITLLLTDGDDCHSHTSTAADVNHQNQFLQNWPQLKKCPVNPCRRLFINFLTLTMSGKQHRKKIGEKSSLQLLQRERNTLNRRGPKAMSGWQERLQRKLRRLRKEY